MTRLVELPYADVRIAVNPDTVTFISVVQESHEGRDAQVVRVGLLDDADSYVDLHPPPHVDGSLDLTAVGLYDHVLRLLRGE